MPPWRLLFLPCPVLEGPSQCLRRLHIRDHFKNLKWF
jgi:hypothetical protein